MLQKTTCAQVPGQEALGKCGQMLTGGVEVADKRGFCVPSCNFCVRLKLLRNRKLQISRRGLVLLLRRGRSVLLPGGHRASRWVTGKGTCSGLALTCASLSLLLPGFGRHSSVSTLPTALPGPEHMTTTRQLPLLLKLEKRENILSGSARLVAVKDQHFRKGTVMALKQTETLSI